MYDKATEIFLKSITVLVQEQTNRPMELKRAQEYKVELTKQMGYLVDHEK